MSTTSRRWPVHPPPLPDETLVSWLIRCARGNASKLSPWLAATMGQYGDGLSFDRTENPDDWKCFAEGGALSGTDRIRALTFVDIERRLSDHGASRWVLSTDERVTRAKHVFCAACLTSDAQPYLRRAWRLEWVRWCPVHACRMREGCPKCGAILAPWRRPWDTLFTSCAECERDVATHPSVEEADRALASRFVIDAIRESVGLVRDDQLSPEASPFPTVWSLQKWAELVGHSHWPEWVEELGLGEGVEGTPPTEGDGVAWSFALAWQLHKMPHDALAGLVRRHQASFNRAMTTHCPETLRPLIQKVFTPAPFKSEDVERAVMTLIESDSPVTYLAVAEAIGVSPSRIGSNSVMREIVDRAEPIMRQKWCEAMSEKLRASQTRLKAAGRRVSRLNLAKDARVSLEAIARHEKETGETFAISPSSQYATEVKRAIRSLRERGERITTTAVARELKRDRNLIEKDPDLKAIVKAAQEGKITEVDVRGACRALRERELPISIVAVAEFLEQGRHVIERSGEFRAVVEEERRIVAGELKREIEDAVWRLAKPGGPPSDSAISKAIGRERSFLSKHENLQALVREFYWTKLRFPDRVGPTQPPKK